MFQNIVEDMILFQDMSDEAIIDFYKELKACIRDKQIHIVYLKTGANDIRKNPDTARRDRVNGIGRHWVHRQKLELRICEELFPGQYTVLPSKRYGREIELWH